MEWSVLSILSAVFFVLLLIAEPSKEAPPSPAAEAANRLTDQIRISVDRVMKDRCPISSCLTPNYQDKKERADASCAAAFRYLRELGEDQLGFCGRVEDCSCQRVGWCGVFPECAGSYWDPMSQKWYQISLRECLLRARGYDLGGYQ